MRRGVVAAVAGSLVLIGTLALRGTGGAEPDNSESAQAASYEIGLIGDMPYGDAGRQQFPWVIDEINHAHLAFTTFDGDIKNGSERCDQGQYDLAAKNFAAFQAPLVYVPGDNEWTDCDRASNGSYNPNERLALIRKMFAATPNSLGQRTIALRRQSLSYPENVRWNYGQVGYVGVNVPGSDNNAPQFDATGKHIDGDAAEYAARNAANLAWLDDSFAKATTEHAKAVMVVIQADMWATADRLRISPTPSVNSPAWRSSSRARWCWSTATATSCRSTSR